MKKTLFIFGCLLIVVPVAWGQLSASKFPGTFEDISFKSRMDALTDGYKPMFDKQLYQELNIASGEEIYFDNEIALAEEELKQQEKDVKTMPREEYCEKHPTDTDKCPEKAPSLDETRGGGRGVPDDDSVVVIPAYSGYTIGGGVVIENNSVTGGSCYPVDRETYFTNKILSTGKYEKTYPAFEKGLITVFRKEGKCGETPYDKCGYTCYGIGESKYCAGVHVNNRAEAEEVYYKQYYKNYKIDTLPDVIGTDVFVVGIGSGTGTTLGDFREFLGLPRKTRAVDDQMINAVKNYSGGDIHNNWITRHEQLLRGRAVGYKTRCEKDAKTQEEIKKCDKLYKNVLTSWMNSIPLKRKNGCHVRPKEPQMRKQ